MSEPRETEGDGVEERVRRQSRLLREKIARAQGAHSAGLAEPASKSAGDMSGMGRALRLGSEFIAAILVGAIAGFLLDQWLKTSPWILLVMVLIGFAAGVRNVVASASEMNRAAQVQPVPDQTAPGSQDEK